MLPTDTLIPAPSGRFERSWTRCGPARFTSGPASLRRKPYGPVMVMLGELDIFLPEPVQTALSVLQSVVAAIEMVTAALLVEKIPLHFSRTQFVANVSFYDECHKSLYANSVTNIVFLQV